MQLSDDALTSIQYCANYMADMYNLSFEKAKELIMKSHYPSLFIEDYWFCEHVSFNKWAKEIINMIEKQLRIVNGKNSKSGNKNRNKKNGKIKKLIVN